jgi:hypothetical protein
MGVGEPGEGAGCDGGGDELPPQAAIAIPLIAIAIRTDLVTFEFCHDVALSESWAPHPREAGGRFIRTHDTARADGFPLVRQGT